MNYNKPIKITKQTSNKNVYYEYEDKREEEIFSDRITDTAYSKHFSQNTSSMNSESKNRQMKSQEPINPIFNEDTHKTTVLNNFGVPYDTNYNVPKNYVGYYNNMINNNNSYIVPQQYDENEFYNPNFMNNIQNNQNYYQNLQMKQLPKQQFYYPQNLGYNNFQQQQLSNYENNKQIKPRNLNSQKGGNSINLQQVKTEIFKPKTHKITNSEIPSQYYNHSRQEKPVTQQYNYSNIYRQELASNNTPIRNGPIDLTKNLKHNLKPSNSKIKDFSQPKKTESKKTINSLVSDKKLPELTLNIEDLLLHEEKLSDIMEELCNDPSNPCYEWWAFNMSSSLTGKFENFFIDNNSKIIITEHSVLEFITVILCYDCEINSLSIQMEKYFTQAFCYISNSLMLFSDYLLSKISSTCQNNIWVKKLKLLIKRKLKLSPNNKEENIRVISYNNDNLITINKTILKEHPGNEDYLDMLYAFLQNPNQASLLILSDIFRNKVLKFRNTNKSVIASALHLNKNLKEETINNSLLVDDSSNILNTNPSNVKPYKRTTSIRRVSNNIMNNKPSIIKETIIKEIFAENEKLKSDDKVKELKNEIEKDLEMLQKTQKSSYSGLSTLLNKNKSDKSTSDLLKKNHKEPEESNPIKPKLRGTISCVDVKKNIDKDIEIKNFENSVQDNGNNNKGTETISKTETPIKKESLISNEEKIDPITPRAIAPYIKNSNLKKKFCLVLDLDETLIHFKIDNKNPDQGEIRMRSYMFEFLEQLGKFYEIIMWTAATEDVYFYFSMEILFVMK